VRAGYNGQEALTFNDYTDLETGKTLHAIPGGTYDIAPASGHVVPEVPEPWFTLLPEEDPYAAEPAADAAWDGPVPVEPEQVAPEQDPAEG
jgi:hypothetical protein